MCIVEPAPIWEVGWILMGMSEGPCVVGVRVLHLRDRWQGMDASTLIPQRLKVALGVRNPLCF